MKSVVSIQAWRLECRVLTPMFIAGADQAEAELRVPSIRGELRWWFRVLGGSSADETAVFGGVNDDAVRSSVEMRIGSCDVKAAAQNDILSLRAGSQLAYLWYFVKAGREFTAKSHIAPGSEFQLEVRLRPRRHLTGRQTSLLLDSLRAFATLGALGYRSTRAAGAIALLGGDLPQPITTGAELAAFAQRYTTRLKIYSLHTIDGDRVVEDDDNWRPICIIAEHLLHSLRKQPGYAADGGKNTTCLGSANPRQRSGVLLRPIRLDGKLQLAVVQVRSVLGAPSARSVIDLDGYRFPDCFANGQIFPDRYKLHAVDHL